MPHSLPLYFCCITRVQAERASMRREKEVDYGKVFQILTGETRLGKKIDLVPYHTRYKLQV